MTRFVAVDRKAGLARTNRNRSAWTPNDMARLFERREPSSKALSDSKSILVSTV